MLPIKTSPAKETRRRTALNGSDVGDIEYASSHHSNEGSPQKGLLSHAHQPSEKHLVRSSHPAPCCCCVGWYRKKKLRAMLACCAFGWAVINAGMIHLSPVGAVPPMQDLYNQGAVVMPSIWHQRPKAACWVWPRPASSLWCWWDTYVPTTSSLWGMCWAQDFYTQVDAAKAAKGFSGSSEAPSSLAGIVKTGKRTVVLVGAGLLGLLVLYVMWPSGSSYGYDGVEETEHFISVSGTQVLLWQPRLQSHKHLSIRLMNYNGQTSCETGGHWRRHCQAAREGQIVFLCCSLRWSAGRSTCQASMRTIWCPNP